MNENVDLVLKEFGYIRYSLIYFDGANHHTLRVHNDFQIIHNDYEIVKEIINKNNNTNIVFILDNNNKMIDNNHEFIGV